MEPAKRNRAETNVALPKNLNISNKIDENPMCDLLSFGILNGSGV